MYDSQDFFAPMFPWQKSAWHKATQQYQNGHLPHGLLASGMAGIGKRVFVARFVAWLLCTDHDEFSACGSCQSCVWLKAGVHPDLRYLPDSKDAGVKIDDVRQLQDFFYTKSAGIRIVVFDNADVMTLGASNALLKTLEEPSEGVYLILISDYPNRLLATIKSRTQNLGLGIIDPALSYDYVVEHNQGIPAKMLLAWADYAPLLAKELPDTSWFAYRKAWLGTYAALYLHKRTAVQASDYWQGELELSDFLRLSQLMLLSLWRIGLDLPSGHEDIDATALMDAAKVAGALAPDKLSALDQVLQETALALMQNIQPKQAYDALFVHMAALGKNIALGANAP